MKFMKDELLMKEHLETVQLKSKKWHKQLLKYLIFIGKKLKIFGSIVWIYLKIFSVRFIHYSKIFAIKFFHYSKIIALKIFDLIIIAYESIKNSILSFVSDIQKRKALSHKSSAKIKTDNETEDEIDGDLFGDLNQDSSYAYSKPSSSKENDDDKAETKSIISKNKSKSNKSTKSKKETHHSKNRKNNKVNDSELEDTDELINELKKGFK